MILFGLLLTTPLQAGPDDIHAHPTVVTDEELFAALDLDRPGLERVRTAVAAGDYAAAATEWAERLATGPTKAHMFTKWLVNRALDVDRTTIAEEESWAVELNTGTHDSQEGVKSFQERREPLWRGF